MSLKLPAGACNAHCHVFGPVDRFPYPPGSKLTATSDAPKEALYALNDSLGLERCVVVQSARHGFDNRATADAVLSRPATYRGIALVPTDVPDAEITRLDGAGFRGVRFNFINHLGAATPIAEIMALAQRLIRFGWHLQIHCEAALLAELSPHLLKSPVPVVIDHIGKVDPAAGLGSPAFKTLLRLMEDERIWVKVSGMDRMTRLGPPYTDAQPFARMLVTEFGDRVVWGNDWPHPNHPGPRPDPHQLVNLIATIAPTADAIRRLMVTNPNRLYRFGALA